MDIAAWAKDELQGIDLGDRRLNARAEIVLTTLGQRPNMSIPAACRGHAEMAAAYRFFDNDKVTFDKVLQPHIEQTRRRMAEQNVVLLPQDTTELDLTRPESTVHGVGELDSARRGILLHVTQAFTPDGTPLGTTHAEIINRTEGVLQATAEEKHKRNKARPIEAKETLRWLTGLRDARELAQQLPGVQLVCLADSEGDVYELFAEPRGERPVHWLVRACQNRALLQPNPDEDDGGRDEKILDNQEMIACRALLRETLLATPKLDEVELRIRGRVAKTEVESRSRRVSRETRIAQVEVRAATVTLRPPWRPDRKLPPITVNAVLVREMNPPAGEEPVEWLLLTTLPIDGLDDVRKVVEYYCVRWMIEIYFRTLKSGCRIEERRFENLDRVLPCLAICMIVAWRTLFVSRLGRACPELDCEAIFEPSEWKAVWVAVHRQKPPKRPPPLGEMVRLIASLGGYVQRPDTEPGTQTLWIGMQRMYDLALAWDTFGPGAPKNPNQDV